MLLKRWSVSSTPDFTRLLRGIESDCFVLTPISSLIVPTIPIALLYTLLASHKVVPLQPDPRRIVRSREPLPARSCPA
jgi:hypothetical protein